MGIAQIGVTVSGANGQMLMADSSATAGLRYVDPPANRNLLINGAMNVHQRGTSKTGLANDTLVNTADRWYLVVSNMGTNTQDIQTDAPAGSGFNKSFRVLVTTADAAPAAADGLNVHMRLEGQDLQRIKKGTASAEQLTLSFWVKSNVTGTYVAMLSDIDNTRQVGAQYTVSASGTWERKTITFPADTTGAFDNDNAESLRLFFWLGAGSDRTSGTFRTTWTSTTTADIAVGQTNLAAATNNYWQITGVQLETGPVATPFEFEPYEATLRKCQRYYWRSETGGAFPVIANGSARSTTSAVFVLHHPTPMRVSATAVEYSGTIAMYDSTANTVSTVVQGVLGKTREATTLEATGTGFTQFRPYTLYVNEAGPASGYVALTAEL